MRRRSRCGNPLRHRLQGFRRRGDEGAAIVEFALVLPVFALMLFGMIQFGLTFTGWTSLRSSVQIAARDAGINQVETSASCTEFAQTPACASCPEGQQAASSIPPVDIGTQEMLCNVENLIGTSLVGTDVSPTNPASVALVVDNTNNLVKVCTQVTAQAVGGFLPTITLSAVSAFTIEDMGGPFVTAQSAPPVPFDIGNGADKLKYTIDAGPTQTLTIAHAHYTTAQEVLAAVQAAIQAAAAPLTASLNNRDELVLTTTQAGATNLAVTGGNAASKLGFTTIPTSSTGNTALQSYNPDGLPGC